MYVLPGNDTRGIEGAEIDVHLVREKVHSPPELSGKGLRSVVIPVRAVGTAFKLEQPPEGEGVVRARRGSGMASCREYREKKKGAADGGPEAAGRRFH